MYIHTRVHKTDRSVGKEKVKQNTDLVHVYKYLGLYSDSSM